MAAYLGATVAGRIRGAGATGSRRATGEDVGLLVRHVPALALLDEPGRRDLVRVTRVIHVAEGEMVVRAGDSSDAAYFVLRGRLVARDPGGEGTALSTMEAGDFFGEITALTGGPRTADVVAEEATRLLVVPATALRRLASIPEARDLLLSRLSERLARSAPAGAGEQAESVEPVPVDDGRRTTAESLPRSYGD
jgi:CRP-like cAMP-binding protein